MKHVVILFDGMADYPDQNGRTPMQDARKPHTDALCKTAEVGLTVTVPQGMKAGSDVANLACMGYDPRVCYTGRSPLEAVSMGISLGERDVTYRCNLVTLSDEKEYENKTMLDYSAGEISTAEAKKLISFLDGHLEKKSNLMLHAGISYRHCLLRKNGEAGAVLTPPHDISDRCIGDYLPKGIYADELLSLQKQSSALLKDHPVNLSRIEQGKKPASSVWFWGEGTKPNIQNFFEKTGLKGAVISAVDLIKGIGICAGMDSINVEGATGTIASNFAGKADAAIKALKTHDYVYVHLEAPDECGHQGDRAGKTRAIELIDEKIVAPVVAALNEQNEPYRLLIMPDHPTPTALKTHTPDPVPYLLYDSTHPKHGAPCFTEQAALQTGVRTPYAWELWKK